MITKNNKEKIHFVDNEKVIDARYRSEIREALAKITEMVEEFLNEDEPNRVGLCLIHGIQNSMASKLIILYKRREKKSNGKI